MGKRKKAKTITNFKPADLPADENRGYVAMHYKNGNSIGIRRTYGLKNQVFSFGGSQSSLNKDQLLAIGRDVIKEILAGTSYQKARDAGHKRATPLVG